MELEASSGSLEIFGPPQPLRGQALLAPTLLLMLLFPSLCFPHSDLWVCQPNPACENLNTNFRPYWEKSHTCLQHFTSLSIKGSWGSGQGGWPWQVKPPTLLLLIPHLASVLALFSLVTKSAFFSFSLPQKITISSPSLCDYKNLPTFSLGCFPLEERSWRFAMLRFIKCELDKHIWINMYKISKIILWW